ncbi:hypothetical protein AB1E18_015312 [Capra hircus]
MDLTEAEDIKKRWQEYTEELYKNDLHDPDNHDGVITHLEPDILECEVKWALESITMNKASGGYLPLNISKISENQSTAVSTSISLVLWHSSARRIVGRLLPVVAVAVLYLLLLPNLKE